MIRALPIRVQLTVWYSSVLALCLVAFGLVVWFGLRESLVSGRQAELDGTFRNLRAVVLEHPGISNEALGEEISEFSAALSTDFSMMLSDPKGLVVFSQEKKRIGRAVEREDLIDVQGRQYRLHLRASLGTIDEILGRLSRILLLSVPFALLVASFGGYWLSGRTMRPVRNMALAARAIGAGNLSSRLPVPEVNDELSLLATMWNEMLGRLEGSVERTRRFTSDASHDLRTPLATIRASAEISLRKQREPQHYRQTIEGILRQTDRATSLVESLLTLARVDSGQTASALTVLDLSQVAADAFESLRVVALAKNLDFRLTIAAEPVLVTAHRESLGQALRALVDNAIKYTDQGSVEVRVKATGELATVAVSDTGSGIDPADVPHIFDRFYRGDKSRSAALEGFGLGLAIAKESLILHRGTIDVEATPGKGTRFTVSLPLVHVEPAGTSPSAD